MRIAILCHWHTGSTLIAKTFRACGMEVGNAKTNWIPSEDDPSCEHGRLNGLGDAFILGKITEGELREGVTEILTSYVQEAELKEWEHYGVKITHVTQKRLWPIFKELFDSLWSPVYVTTIRSPLAVIKSTSNDKTWTPKQIMDSYMSSLPALYEIKQMGVSFLYPNDWFDNRVREKVEKIGLTWNVQASNLFDPNRQKGFTEYDLAKWERMEWI